MGDQLQPHCSRRFRRPHATFLALAWQVLVRDLWTMSCGVTPVVRYSLSHHQALDCASALDRVCRLQPLHLLMAARQTSITTTTAPPAPNTRHECGDRVSRVHHSSCCVSHSCRTAPIHNHLVARTGHLCQGCNDRASQGARGDDCKLAHTARHRLSFKNLRAKIARILFRATANYAELSLTQRLLMPQVTRLEMSHPTTTNSVNHATAQHRSEEFSSKTCFTVSPRAQPDPIA